MRAFGGADKAGTHAAYRRGAVWVEPVLGAKVELTEFTNEGYVRQSSFIDLIEPT